MNRYLTGRQALPIVLLAAVLFPIAAAGIIGGMNLPEINVSDWERPILFTAMACLVSGLSIAGWRVRATNAKRRLEAALDAYADREIARERRWKTLHRPWTFSTAHNVSSQAQSKRTHSRRNTHARPQSQSW